MCVRWRRLGLLGASALSIVGLSLAGMSAPAGATTPPLNLVLTGPHPGVTTFTLPTNDGFRDSAKFTITAARRVDVDIAMNAEGTIVKTIHAGTLSKAKHGYSKTMTITDSGLADSGYDIDAYVHGTTDVPDKAPSLPGQVSNGKISTFTITQPTVYPDVKGSLSTLTSVFTATDDRGTALPLHDAHLTLACPSTLSATASRGAKEESSSHDALSLKLSIPLYNAPAPFGQAGCSGGSNLIASGEGPADTGPQFKDGTATILLAQISSVSVGTEFDVVYPRKDGYLDTASFTVAPSPGTSEVLPASGYMDVLAPGTGKVVKKFTITKLPQKFTWDGRVGSAIVPGSYQIVAHAKEADNPGLVTAPSVSMQVLADELHKHTASLGWQEATDLVGGFHSGTAISGQPTPFCEIDAKGRLVCDGSQVDASASAANVSAYAALDSTNLPPAVLAANEDGSWPVHVTAEIDTSALKGKGRIETIYHTTTTDFSLKDGEHTYHLPDLYPDGSGLHMTIGTVEASTFTIPKFKFTFVYYTFS